METLNGSENHRWSEFEIALLLILLTIYGAMLYGAIHGDLPDTWGPFGILR